MSVNSPNPPAGGEPPATSLENIGLDIAPGIHERIALSDAKIRKKVAGRVTKTFVKSNLVVLGFIGVMFIFDVILLCSGVIQPSQRIISSRVVMTIIGATTVQLGAFSIIMAKYLFPTAKPESLWSRLSGRG